jgi:hypothetical protein
VSDTSAALQVELVSPWAPSGTDAPISR